MIQENRKNQERINYKNFALAMLAIIGIIVFIIIIGSIGFFDGLNDNSIILRQHPDPYSKGLFVGAIIRRYISLGLLLGNVFALIASIEKYKSLPKAILYGLLGWAYVIYYARTNKTISTH